MQRTIGNAAVCEVLERISLASVADQRQPDSMPRGSKGDEVVQRDPIAPALLPGEKSKAWSVSDYIAMWEKKHGSTMSPNEKDDLERGCIGITNLNLESGSVDPPLTMSFSTFAQARAVADALNAVLRSKPTLDKFKQMIQGNKLLKQLQNVVLSLPTNDPTEWKAVIFSKRFYSNQDRDWAKRTQAKPGHSCPTRRQVRST